MTCAPGGQSNLVSFDMIVLLVGTQMLSYMAFREMLKQTCEIACSPWSRFHV